MTKNNFSYKWNLKKANFSKDRGKVFSCFSCGGGSSMGTTACAAVKTKEYIDFTNKRLSKYKNQTKLF